LTEGLLPGVFLDPFLEDIGDALILTAYEKLRSDEVVESS
jgi:hypothetical protein